MQSHENIFTLTYQKNIWGDNKNLNYKGSSGYGSKIDFLKPVYIPFIKNFITLNGIKSIVDLGCGDFISGQEIYDNIKNISYTGYDVYKDLINYHNKTYNNSSKYKFIHLDILEQKNEIIDADLYIIKDLFQHWTNNEIISFLSYIINKKNFKYILITNSFAEKEFIDIEQNVGAYRPLSARFFPLKQFQPVVLLLWGKIDFYYEWKQNWYPYKMETSLIIKNL